MLYLPGVHCNLLQARDYFQDSSKIDILGLIIPISPASYWGRVGVRGRQKGTDVTDRPAL